MDRNHDAGWTAATPYVIVAKTKTTSCTCTPVLLVAVYLLYSALGYDNCYCYPAPGMGTGFCFRAISFFVYLFLCQQDYEKTAGPICMKFSGKVWSDHGTTWFNFGSIRVNGWAGRRSSCLLSPAIAQSHLHSLGAGFVVPRTTACSCSCRPIVTEIPPPCVCQIPCNRHVSIAAGLSSRVCD